VALTVPPHRYSEILYFPEKNSRNDANVLFDKMKFDPEHYYRSYFLCRGSGQAHDQCIGISPDRYITPQATTAALFQKHVVRSAECMASSLDSAKCDGVFRGFHEELNYQPPPPSSLNKAKSFCGKLATKVFGRSN